MPKPPKPKNGAERQKLINRALKFLEGNFDTIQIITTHHNHETEITQRQNGGIGNQFACLGSVRSWIQDTEREGRPLTQDDLDEPDEKTGFD